MNNNDEIVKELNDYLRGINMGYDTFKTYVEKVKDPNLKSEFQSIISTFNAQKELIMSFIAKLNGKINDSLGIRGEMALTFEKIKEVFMNNDKEILHNAIKGIDMGILGTEKEIATLKKISADMLIINTLDGMLKEYKAINSHLNEYKNTVGK